MTVAPDFFTVFEPIGDEVPILVSSPHSGRIYPAQVLDNICINPDDLRFMEDLYTDELCNFATNSGASLLVANYARAYLDLNRPKHSIDTKLIEGIKSTSYCPYAQAGIGLIARVVRKNNSIYHQKIPYSELEKRLNDIHIPYHAFITQRLGYFKNKFDKALLIDVHSMPKDALGTNQCDIIVGNNYSRSANLNITNTIIDFFKSHGFKTRLNQPYAGGFITQNHAKTNENINAVQIEINRALYVNQDNFEKTQNFENLQKILGQFFDYMAQFSKQ